VLLVFVKMWDKTDAEISDSIHTPPFSIVSILLPTVNLLPTPREHTASWLSRSLWKRLLGK
jgi:hypothetical protein